jgi:aspartyl-tRNA(Asn)/glutamyl-tRNA(Gln) amidotransferase subunit B
VRPKGRKEFGIRSEIKNLNSFKFTKQAIEYEIKRQVAILEKGEKVIQESRLFDPTEGKTRPMRSKEEAHDYRYFPEPDLAPLVLDAAFLDPVKAQLPELPHAKKSRFTAQYGLSDYDAGVLCADKALADWYEAGAKHTGNFKALANWVMGDMAARMKEAGAGLADLKFDAVKLSGLIALVDQGAINSKQAKDVFAELYESGEKPGLIVKEKGMAQVTDPAAIEEAVGKVLAAHPSVAAEYKGGKQGVLGFLVGKVMQATQGKANPRMVNEILARKLKD